jgi:DNA-binding HxlR family transcriptional regulator
MEAPLNPMKTPQSSPSDCPIYRTIEKLSKKWTLLILRSFMEKKTLRFSQILEELPEINTHILSKRLSELEKDGLIVRKVAHTKPIIISYDISSKGQALEAVFDHFAAWAKTGGKDVPVKHRVA